MDGTRLVRCLAVNAPIRRLRPAYLMLLLAGALGAVVAGQGCARRPTMAVKSLVAYDETAARGETIPAAGGHGALAVAEPSDHAHGAEPVPSTEPAAAPDVAHGEADHRANQAPPHLAEPHQHPAAERATAAAPQPPRLVPRNGIEPDAIDAPAPTVLAEADRAAALLRETSGGHMDHGSTTYRQTDAGRGPEAAASYTCPMHPEVISATPGKCPKCGMTLVPKS